MNNAGEYTDNQFLKYPPDSIVRNCILPRCQSNV